MNVWVWIVVGVLSLLTVSPIVLYAFSKRRIRLKNPKILPTLPEDHPKHVRKHKKKEKVFIFVPKKTRRPKSQVDLTNIADSQKNGEDTVRLESQDELNSTETHPQATVNGKVSSSLFHSLFCCCLCLFSTRAAKYVNQDGHKEPMGEGEAMNGDDEEQVEEDEEMGRQSPNINIDVTTDTNIDINIDMIIEPQTSHLTLPSFGPETDGVRDLIDVGVMEGHGTPRESNKEGSSSIVGSQVMLAAGSSDRLDSLTGVRRSPLDMTFNERLKLKSDRRKIKKLRALGFTVNNDGEGSFSKDMIYLSDDSLGPSDASLEGSIAFSPDKSPHRVGVPSERSDSPEPLDLFLPVSSFQQQQLHHKQQAGYTHSSVEDIVALRKERRERQKQERQLRTGELDSVVINSGPPRDKIPRGYVVAGIQAIPDIDAMREEKIMYLFNDSSVSGWFMGTFIGPSMRRDGNYHVRFEVADTLNVKVGGLYKLDLHLSGANAYGRRWILLQKI